jgi:sortase A
VTTTETSRPTTVSGDVSPNPAPEQQQPRWRLIAGRVRHWVAPPRGGDALPPPSALATTVVTALAMLSLIAIWLLVYAIGLSAIQERSAQHRLYASIRQSLAEEVAPFGGAIEPGTPIAVMTAPEAGLRRVVVVEGTTAGVMRDGPGHQQNTALPGQAGVSVVMGRSVTFGAPFRHVASLHVGDPITVTTGQGVFTYTVTDVRGNGDPLPPTLAATASRLTLVTSRGSGWRSGWAPGSPVFVDATMKGHVQPAPSGRPTTIATSATEMHSDTGGLVPLVLWLQVLLLVAAGVVWANARWGRWQAWLAGAPLVLVVLWLISSETLRLLPNLV